MKKSIFRKLLSMNLLVIMVTLLIIAILLSRLVSSYIYEQKERELSAKGRELSQLIVDSQEGRHNEDTTLYILSTLDQFWEARIWVVDRRGLVVMASHGEQHFRKAPRFMISETEQLEQILAGETVAVRRFMPRFEETMLSVGVPVVAGNSSGEVLGAVFLHSPITGIEAVASQLRSLIALAGLAAVILASILGYFYSLHLSSPIKEMTGIAKKMSGGDFSQRIKTDAKDEIGQLGNSLNYLSQHLQETMSILKEEKENFESMVTSMHEGVVGVDSLGCVVYFNAAAAEMLALPKQAVGLKLEQLFTNPQLLEAFNKTLDQGKLALVVVRSADLVLSVHISPVIKGDSERWEAVALIQDISEAEKLEKMRREFIANVSHELRTPLTTIRGFTESLRDGTASEPTLKKRYLNIIAEESERMGTLIEDLLDLSRLESGRMEIEQLPFSLKETAASVVSRLQSIILKKELQVCLEIPELPLLEGDKYRIEQVLRNLLENAAGFVPAGGRIHVKAVSKEALGVMEISVEDNGPGIPVKELPHIWERFYRVEKSRSPREGGTGLGLSIAKQIVETHGGHIWAQNAPGGGAVFKFNLPVAGFGEKDYP